MALPLEQLNYSRVQPGPRVLCAPPEAVEVTYSYSTSCTPGELQGSTTYSQGFQMLVDSPRNGPCVAGHVNWALTRIWGVAFPMLHTMTTQTLYMCNDEREILTHPPTS